MPTGEGVDAFRGWWAGLPGAGVGAANGQEGSVGAGFRDVTPVECWGKSRMSWPPTRIAPPVTSHMRVSRAAQVDLPAPEWLGQGDGLTGFDGERDAGDGVRQVRSVAAFTTPEARYEAVSRSAGAAHHLRIIRNEDDNAAAVRGSTAVRTCHDHTHAGQCGAAPALGAVQAEGLDGGRMGAQPAGSRGRGGQDRVVERGAESLATGLGKHTEVAQREVVRRCPASESGEPGAAQAVGESARLIPAYRDGEHEARPGAVREQARRHLPRRGDGLTPRGLGEDLLRDVRHVEQMSPYRPPLDEVDNGPVGSRGVVPEERAFGGAAARRPAGHRAHRRQAPRAASNRVATSVQLTSDHSFST